jgi:hypothetical protein
LYIFLATEPKYKNECSGNGAKLFQFNGKRKIDSAVPCKYHAVRQQCGKWWVNLTPGNIWRWPQ